MFALENFERFSSKRLRISRLKRIKLLLRVLALVALIAAGKVAAHRFGWEVIQLNPLFTTLVASTVFLLGFLLNGVLADYKESEKLPGELATHCWIPEAPLFDFRLPIHTLSFSGHKFLGAPIPCNKDGRSSPWPNMRGTGSLHHPHTPLQIIRS